MKKLAIFAEGGTEQAFAERLLLETAGSKNIQIRKEKFRGGGRILKKRQAVSTEYSGSKDGHQFYALIVDCGTDNRVKSDIIENYKKLCDEKYNLIIGFRDARGQDEQGNPITLADIPRVRMYAMLRVPTKPIKPLMVLAIMETEAWFLAEHTHFSRIDPALSLATAVNIIGFDPSRQDIEQRPQPAEDLHTIYQAAGKAYVKEPTCIQRTVDA